MSAFGLPPPPSWCGCPLCRSLRMHCRRRRRSRYPERDPLLPSFLHAMQRLDWMCIGDRRRIWTPIQAQHSLLICIFTCRQANQEGLGIIFMFCKVSRHLARSNYAVNYRPDRFKLQFCRRLWCFMYHALVLAPFSFPSGRGLISVVSALLQREGVPLPSLLAAAVG